MEAKCTLTLTSHWVRDVPEEGMYFRKHDSLQLRDTPKEGSHCDPSTARALGSWPKEHTDPQRRPWEAQHSTLDIDYTNSLETCFSP